MILYIKQAWNLLKQEKLFSFIYIIGTALSITMAMVLAIILYIKIANIYPETNRDRILIANRCTIQSDEGAFAGGWISLLVAQNCFSELQKAEVVSIYCANFGEEYFVQHPGGQMQIPASVKLVDHNYWKVFPFLFRNGRAFTEADVQSGVQTAVISETMAKKVFAEIDVQGKFISLNFRQYRVVGVVKDPSFALPETYAHIWAPYTTNRDAGNTWGDNQSFGRIGVYILAPTKKAVKAVKEEAQENIQKYSSTFEKSTFSMGRQPFDNWENAVWRDFRENSDFTGVIIIYIFIFLIFLVVPAISLSGMVDSRMERRIAECGIRRAFGAPNKALMFQIISENMLFTLLGGVTGLIISYLLILVSRNSILQLGKMSSELPVDGTDILITPGMLLNWTVFAMALGICILLNLLSAVIPAWRASRHPIVYSLTAKSN